MNYPELKIILSKHYEWLKDPSKGEQANLTGLNFTYENLDSVNLQEVILEGANLRYAGLRRANLQRYSFLLD